jgi:hypothetical protein
MGNKNSSQLPPEINIADEKLDWTGADSVPEPV